MLREHFLNTSEPSVSGPSESKLIGDFSGEDGTEITSPDFSNRFSLYSP